MTPNQGVRRPGQHCLRTDPSGGDECDADADDDSGTEARSHRTETHAISGSRWTHLEEARVRRRRRAHEQPRKLPIKLAIEGASHVGVMPDGAMSLIRTPSCGAATGRGERGSMPAAASSAANWLLATVSR